MSAVSAAAVPLRAQSRGDRQVIERELLGRLGLPFDASPQDIDRTHDDLVAFLETAPHDLRGWASRQVAAADEAYALLSDPSAALPRGDVELAVDEPETADEPADGPLAPRGTTRSDRRAMQAALRAAAEPDRRTRVFGLGPVRRVILAAAVIVAAVTVGYAVYASDAPAVPGLTGTPAPEDSAAAIDTAQVAALMQKIQADPKDVASLQSLGDIYFQAGEYAVAADWERKVVAIEPKNTTALLGLGAAEYNQGNSTDAEKQWRAVLAIDPKNVEAHYDLGFMYFSADPPDIAKTTAEWNAVIEIAPDSDIAQTVATHLKTLQVSSPAASAGAAVPDASGAAASGAPGAGASAGAAAASAAPASTPGPAASPAASTAP